MTARSSGSQKPRKLSLEEEAFAAWFLRWWHRQGRHIDFSANAAPADQQKPSAASEIEVWQEVPEPIRRPRRNEGATALNPQPSVERRDLQAKSR
jgi:hypothetical protein